MDLLKIVVFGPECTGKTTLTQKLSQHFQTSFSAEYIRHYLNARKIIFPEIEPFTVKWQDLSAIVTGQLATEEQAMQAAGRVVFMDTNLLTSMVYIQHYFGELPAWFPAQTIPKRYDHYLLLQPDIPWQADPQRESEATRALLFSVMAQKLQELNLPFTTISGPYQHRVQQAISVVSTLLNYPSGT